MKRRHLFELEDQAWLPAMFRQLLTELLQYQIERMDWYAGTIPILGNLIQQSGYTDIWDCCSGAAGPWPTLLPQLQKHHQKKLKVTLSDKYPYLKAWQQLETATNGQISYCAQAIDATRFAYESGKIYTFFTGFHHFKPEAAQQILNHVSKQGVTIAIFEFTYRSPAHVKAMLKSPRTVWRLSQRMPFRFSRFLWTYVLPIVPFIYWWDGTVSHLRTYTPHELHDFAKNTNASHYQWEIDTILSQKTGYHLTYLLGYPSE
ncbi:MAG: hypothetical protein AAF629_06520 [Chloroflexota bacterium]